MSLISSDWSKRHKWLSKSIRKGDCFSDAIQTVFDLHAELHASEASGNQAKNAMDSLLDDLHPNEFAIMPTAKDETIAWAIWHIARIEDLTMNLLVNGGSQVFDEGWKRRMNVSVTDTANAMTDEEIMAFSKQIDTRELQNYRNAVGARSRELLRQLRPADMKRKVTTESIERIRTEGGVSEHPDAVWLLDFWGKKDVAGLLLMPLTRHQTLHLNDCDLWKKAIREKKRFFMG